MKFQFRRRPLTKERLGWWLRILLTRIFGRKIKIDGYPKTVRIFPHIHKGELLLMGLEADSFRIEFTGQYSAKIIPSERVTHPEPNPTPPQSTPPGVNLVMLGHQPPDVLNTIHERCMRLGTNYNHLLLYGGRQDDFHDLSSPSKIHIENSTLRGPSNRMSHPDVIEKSWDYFRQSGKSDCYFVFIESDLVPLKPDFLEPCIRLMNGHDADFAAKSIRDVTDTNNPFLLETFTCPVDRRDRKKFHALGCFYVIHPRLIPTFLEECSLMQGTYFEIMFPTAAASAGGRLLSMDSVSGYLDAVRFRPEYRLTDLSDLARSGKMVCHPVKLTRSDISLLDEL
jgi:hypothetical protein